MSLGEMAGSGFASKYTINKPAPEYTRAVEKVQQAPKGTIISKAKTVVAIPAVPKVVTDLITNPLPTIVGGIKDTVFGTKEEQVIQASGWIPAIVQTETTQMDRPIVETTLPQQIVTKQIEIQKQTPEGAAFWESPGAGPGSTIAQSIPEIKLELPDVGGWLDTAKWILIGGGVLVGVYILAKAFGGKK